jgi:hypothetical protein
MSVNKKRRLAIISLRAPIIAPAVDGLVDDDDAGDDEDVPATSDDPINAQRVATTHTGAQPARYATALGPRGRF